MARRKGSYGPKPKKAPAKIDWERQQLLEPKVAELVAAHHPHLQRATIVVLGKPRAAKGDACDAIVKLRLCTKATRALVKGDIGDVAYQLEIGLDRWSQLEPSAQRRRLDHALCHGLGRDDRERWALNQQHDVEEFVSILKRHGVDETASQKAFIRQAKQLELPS